MVSSKVLEYEDGRVTVYVPERLLICSYPVPGQNTHDLDCVLEQEKMAVVDNKFLTFDFYSTRELPGAFTKGPFDIEEYRLNDITGSYNDTSLSRAQKAAEEIFTWVYKTIKNAGFVSK